jgi:PAS domain S-box-containing protein
MNSFLTPAPSGRPRLLVVEDEAIIAADLRQQLLKLGYEPVGHAVSGEQAVQLARELKPDLVLMDIQLAGEMDGVAASRAIQETLALPVIFLTAFGEDQTFERAKLTDPFGYILKPFSERELRTTLAMALYKHGVELRLKQQAQALQEINQELANQKFALDQHALVSATDIKGKITYCNERFCQVSGYSPPELLGQDHRLLNSGTHPQEFFAELWQTLACGQVWRGEICNRAKSGAFYWVNSTIVPLLGLDGKPHTYISIREDITERRLLESRLRQAQKMEAIGRLAGGIAHDFNNILAAIIGYSDLLKQDTAGNAAAQEDIAQILGASTRAKEIVQQILTFSRQHEPKREVIQLDAVLIDAMKLLRASLPAQIKIEMNLAAHPPTVLADATQIYQVILNLAANALHAMEGQPGTLTIELEPFRPDAAFLRAHPDLFDANYARLNITDTGHGMDAQVIERIFEPFYTTKPVGKGTGLGLAVVDGIVRSQSGVITVESVVGQGTTFRLYFPAHTADSPAPETVKGNLAPGHGERILLVDDEPAITALLQRMLVLLNYQVTVSNQPRAAADLFSQQPEQFDVLITDLTMPELSGLELAGKIHSLRPELPIILASGFVPNLQREELQAAGIVEIVGKPIMMDNLAELLRRTLKNSV